MHASLKSHLEAVYRILRNLKGSPCKGFLFQRGEELELAAYTDADRAGSKTDQRLTTGYCKFIGRNLATWRCRKQPMVARSNAQAEFWAMAHGICELLWLKIILSN